MHSVWWCVCSIAAMQQINFFLSIHIHFVYPIHLCTQPQTTDATLIACFDYARIRISNTATVLSFSLCICFSFPHFAPAWLWLINKNTQFVFCHTKRTFSHFTIRAVHVLATRNAINVHICSYSICVAPCLSIYLCERTEKNKTEIVCWHWMQFTEVVYRRNYFASIISQLL